MSAKPCDISEYKKWLDDSLHCLVSSKTVNHYRSVTSKIKTDFDASPFWTELQSRLADINNEYLLNTGYQLLTPKFAPETVIKPFDSLLDKTYRKNVLLNSHWPNPPDNGWITTNNWFEGINDILRTFFVVKYLDGVEFLAGKIQDLAKDFGLEFHAIYEAKEEGYYAAHLYVRLNFDIPKIDWDTESKTMAVEIQITTQLQDVITKLTHTFYEQRRLSTATRSVKWQWDYRSDEFLANYLGHILHYLEGMIMEVRDKQKGSSK